MSKGEDLTGKRFGSWTVLGPCLEGKYSNGRTVTRWECRCQCGYISWIASFNLGKCKDRCVKCRIKTHGHSAKNKFTSKEERKTYSTWSSIKARCHRKSHPRYADWGGRGIKVCDRWLNSYENFLSDMGVVSSMDLEIDRIDNDKGYEPGNCRWTTGTQNARNKRNSHRYEYDGMSKTLGEWGEAYGIHPGTLESRIRQSKWSMERALTTPTLEENKHIINEESHTLSEWAIKYNIDKNLVRNRVYKLGWTLEKALTTPVRKKKKEKKQ